MCTMCMPAAHRGLKRRFDPLELSVTGGYGLLYGYYELLYGYYELNPGPLKEEIVFLTTEPSLQPGFPFLTWTFKTVTALAPNPCSIPGSAVGRVGGSALCELGTRCSSPPGGQRQAELLPDLL